MHLQDLTERHIEILDAYLECYSSKGVGERFKISSATVDVHMLTALHIFNAKNRCHLLILYDRAKRAGLMQKYEAAQKLRSAQLRDDFQSLIRSIE